MRKSLLLCVLLCAATPAYSQITIPYGNFQNGQVADADQINSNYSALGTQALNRTGGTMTGTLTAQQITPSATNTYDLGTAAALFRTGYLRTSLVLGQTTGNYTISWNDPAASRALTVPDPGGADSFAFLAAPQTFTNKTLTSPAITSPTLTCTGCITSTHVLNGTLLDEDVNAAAALAWTKLATTGTIPSAVQDNITRLGTVTTGSFPAANLSGTTLAAGVTASSLTSVGTLTGGATGAGFTLALSTSTITGTLADARLSANVPLLNAANAFTAKQSISATSAGGGQLRLIRNEDATQYLDIIAGGGDTVFKSRTAVVYPAFSWVSVNTATEFTAMTLSGAGLLTVNGFGPHTFSAGGTGGNILKLRNPTAGTGNYADLIIAADTDNIAQIRANSSTLTPAGIQLADGVAFEAAGAGGHSIAATHASGAIRFYTGGTTEAVRVHASRGVSIGDTTDPGATNLRVAGSLVLAPGAVTLSAGTNSDINIGSASVVRLNGGGNVGGFTGGVDGRQLIVLNNTGASVGIIEEDASSTAANRVADNSGPNQSIASAASMLFVYDGTASRWRFVYSF